MTITVTVTAKDGAGNVVTFTETREVQGTTDWDIIRGHMRRKDAPAIESLTILTVSAELFTSFWKSYWGRAGMPARMQQLKALYEYLRPFLDEAVKTGEAVAVDEPYQTAMAKDNEEDPGPAGCPLVWSEDGNSAHTCAAVIRDLKLSHEEITNQRDRAQEALAKSEQKNLDLQRMLMAHRTTLRKLWSASNEVNVNGGVTYVKPEPWAEFSKTIESAKRLLEVGEDDADTELQQAVTILRTLVTHALELGYGEAPAEQDDGSLGRKMDRAVDAAYKFLEKHPA